MNSTFRKSMHMYLYTRDLARVAARLVAAAGGEVGEQVEALRLGHEVLTVEKVGDAKAGVGFALQLHKRSRDGKTNVVFIDRPVIGEMVELFEEMELC